jgi:hypothetical protein
MMMRRFVCALLFLAYVDEQSTLYADYMFSPFHWVGGIFFEGLLAVRLFDVLMLMVLLYGTVRLRSAPSVRPMRTLLFVGASVTLTALAWGLLRGGDARAAGWQVYLPMATILSTFALASVFRTAEHFLLLANTLLAAATYRAVMCLVFYFFYVRDSHIVPAPDYMTTHHDTVVWTIGIPFVLLSALMTPSLRRRVIAAVIVPLFLVAIQLNNRRLAWISLGGTVVVSYVLLPPSAVLRKARRVALILVPVIALYAAVGWGRTEQIFSPLRAFQTVSAEQDKQDNSTKARNVENLGLIATAKQGWVLGSGWGQKYVEITDKYNIHFFELWPYVPHNSVLGLLAYTGYVGFVGYWMLFPVAVFLHARLARFGPSPRDRLVGILGVVQIVACADQWYGDMGSFSYVTMYTLATSFAVALRLPAVVGVWPAGSSSSGAPLHEPRAAPPAPTWG